MPELADARESLAYWEARAERLPRYAFRARREAREMARRWRERVDAAERAVYGAGFVGTLLFVLSEGRLPERTRHGARVAARRGMQAAGVALATCLVLIVLAIVSLVQLAISAF